MFVNNFNWFNKQIQAVVNGYAMSYIFNVLSHHDVINCMIKSNNATSPDIFMPKIYFVNSSVRESYCRYDSQQ